MIPLSTLTKVNVHNKIMTAKDEEKVICSGALQLFRNEHNDLTQGILASTNIPLRLLNINGLYNTQTLLERLMPSHPRCTKIALDIARFEKKQKRIFNAIARLDKLLLEFEAYNDDVEALRAILDAVSPPSTGAERREAIAEREQK